MHHRSPFARLRGALASIAAALCCALAPASAPAATWHDSYDWPAGHGYNGWSHDTTADVGAYAFASPLNDHSGLSLWLPGDRWYLPAAAEWRFDAPGTTRIAAARLRLAYRDNLFAHHCLELGLRDGPAGDTRRTCSPPSADRTYDAALAADARQAYMRVEFPPCHNANGKGCPKWIPSVDPEGNAPLARLESVDMTLVDDDLPTATPSGPLLEKADDYVNGNSSYDLTVAGADAGAGVKEVAVERAGGAQLASGAAACDPTHHTPELGSRICPESHSQTVSVSMQTLPEGSNPLQATATDLAGNTGVSPSWNVLVDRTAPDPVSEMEMSWDPDLNEAVVGWETEDDPDLPDGTPGSGIADYEYRYRHLGDNAWSDWRLVSETISIPGAWIGEEIEVEVRSIDAVGNVSEPGAELLTVPDPANDTDGEDGDSDEADDGNDSNDNTEVLASAAASGPSSMTVKFMATETLASAAAATGCSTYPSYFFWNPDHNNHELRTTRVYMKTGKRITKFDPFRPLLPRCRLGKYGTVDYGRVLHARAGMSAQYHLENRLDLLPAGYKATLRDSFGNKIARIRRVTKCGSRTGDLFAIDTRGGAKYCNRVKAVSAMVIQGYGCIKAPNSARKDWIMFAFDAGSRSLQIRGFIWKDGLRRAVAAAISRKKLTDLPDAECDNGDVNPTRSANDLKNAGLSGSYFRQVGPRRTSGYATYNFRTVKGATAADDVDYAYLLVNTSAVGSGGIARAVVPIENGAGEHALLEQTDFMGYCDPNGVGDKPDFVTPDVTVRPRVRWSYGELEYDGAKTDIEGWVPTDGLSKDPPADAAAGTPGQDPVLDDLKIADPDCGDKLAAPKPRDKGYGYSD
ncbi:MAG TPA: hypothetical protein VE570_13575 [Thermoleophilaceae bacterium]|jgi:hypothetical protein|nr:hypothetical protein [Thermoleophilaceae bacterium]